MNVAIVGFGHWGPNYLKCFQRIDDVQVKYIIDTKFNDTTVDGGIEYLSSIEKAISDDDLDAVVIATPATTHYKIAKECLTAGKHLLVEKPLCIEFEHAEELERLAAQNGLVLKVGHIFLHNLAVTKMRELIDDGVLGKPLYGTSRRTHLGLIRHDVNVFWDLAPHDISIFNFLFGATPVSVNAVGQKHQGSNNEDVCFITLNYPENISAQIMVSWEDANKERTVSVMGSEARMVFDDLNQLEKVKIIKKGLSKNLHKENLGLFHVNLRDGDIFSPNIDPHEPLRVMVEDYLEAIKTGQTELSSEGSTMIKILKGIETSINEDGAPVFV